LAKSPTQPNIRNIVRNCLQLGINHFETARFYGTSEYQLVQALVDLMEAGEIQRHEFIIQTKIVPFPTVKDFMKAWDQTWKHVGPKLQYIDLFTLHGLSNQEYWEVNYAEALKLKEQGKIRHIGFSTHGTSEQIMNLVNTEKVSF
jgi:predicted aldo/keto reductase-like oxidoreductase